MLAGERAPQVPEDTQECDLKLWVKGVAQHEANLGEEMEIVTTTGRATSGTLVGINPGYTHNYGDFQPELLKVELQLKEILAGGDK